MEVVVLLLLFILAFFAESIDIIMGMGFGTLVTPILIAFGYNPLVVLPIVLLLQAIAGLTAGFWHHFQENINLLHHEKIKIALLFVVVGIIGATAGAFFATNINIKTLDQTQYITSIT